jgi:hypothetical protein
MLKPKSVDQFFDVLTKFKTEYAKGYPVAKAYQGAVEEIRKKYSVAYQTIGDLCRRRLGLRTIEDFYGLLEKWVVGDTEPLISVLMNNTKEYSHSKIFDYFKEIGGKPEKQKANSFVAKPEAFNLSLEHETAKKLKVLSLMEENNSSVWLSNAVSEIVEQRYAKWLDNQKK